MADARLELADRPTGETAQGGMVPPPLPPDDPEAWYASDVQRQYEVHPGVVVTVRRRGEEFAYGIREPSLTAADRDRLEAIREHFADARLQRPRTREGAIEVMDAGFSRKHARVIDRLVEPSPPRTRV
jgi:hypothetical protein